MGRTIFRPQDYRPQNIAIWLSGYNCKRGNTIVDTQALIEKSKKLIYYCVNDPETPVMHAAEELFGADK
jgi:hypothetical protein